MTKHPAPFVVRWAPCVLLLGAVACTDGDTDSAPTPPDARVDGTMDDATDGHVDPAPADSGTEGAAETGQPETGRFAGMTAEHNEARANVEPAADPPISPLTWDPDLAAVAQGWADELGSMDCPLVHSGNGYGENIHWTGGSATPAQVVDLWMREAGCYDYASNTCTPGSCSCGSFDCNGCGHYTQVVWRSSERLGCGVAPCSGGGEIWVCNYDPPGNVNPDTTRPY
ncbi:MAG: CAP domain-containing protein [Myxococcota bacterium]